MLHEALGEAKQILTDEQLERFVEIIREDAVWYDFFYTELTTGLRRGEICGLQWRDFDADDGRLKIWRRKRLTVIPRKQRSNNQKSGENIP